MDTVNINGKDYIEKALAETMCIDNMIQSACVGKNVIVRSYSEGINCGTVVAADETGIILSNCRRLWYHKPLDKKTSWYEGVSISGISRDSKVSCTVGTKIIVEKYSVLFCSENAYNTIMGAIPNAQN